MLRPKCRGPEKHYKIWMRVGACKAVHIEDFGV